MMRANKTKAKLAAGQVALGASIAAYAPELVELSAAVGFDFVALDAEHEPLDDGQIVHMIRAAEAFDITPIVRLPKDPDRILRALDAGAQGIHVPRCSTAEDARALVACTRFYPQGKRTFYALGRSANYAIGVDDAAWAQAANRELLVIAMIEEAEALRNLDAILAVPHLDVIHIGPKDLWQSMGMPAAAVVDAAVADITRAAVAAGKHVSVQLRLSADAPERIAGHLRRGARMVTVSPLDFIRQGALAFTARVRQIAAEM
jgi:4-hydroxy-2-oxoheptanedioate aldolase